MRSIEQLKKRLLNILNTVPPLKNILLADLPLDQKRKKIRNWLSETLVETYEDEPDIHPLEYILKRDAINVFGKILSIRNENMAGYSLLKYVNDLLSKTAGDNLPQPGSGFLAELDHLIRGIACKTNIYREKTPAFLKYQGQKAAKLRSADLSRMARRAEKIMQRYVCGLDAPAIRRRSRNKYRILKFFGATELEWDKYQWHLNHTIRDVETLEKLVMLTDSERSAVEKANRLNIPFGITPYYLSLVDHTPKGLRDRVIRAQVMPSNHYVNTLDAQKKQNSSSLDFMLENDTSPIEGITRRYPNIVILKPVLTCPQICVYCQRNWEIEDIYSQKAMLPRKKLKKALNWIKATPEITEVLITGGDPLFLSNSRLREILAGLASNPRIERIRIGTRTPVTLPQRITDALVRTISGFHSPGRREILVVTHFEHAYEITPQSMEAVQKFRRYGMEVYNQLVFTYFNSRKFESAFLRRKLRLIGVTPYYTFNTKGKEETNDFRVPITRLMQEAKEESRLMPGTVRTDEIVFNVPGLGKNYLKASQHHSVISILPNGRRVYEFHPWEEKLALVNTYPYTDVSIYDYLQRLKKDGEDISEYRTLWYYY